MRIGLACVDKKKDDLTFNLNKLAATLVVASQSHCDLVLFGQQYLSTPLTLDSTALFQIKLACVSADVTCGLGFTLKEENQTFNAYIVIDSRGEVIFLKKQYQTVNAFTFMDQSFNVVIGEEGFNTTSSPAILIWPLHTVVSPKEWFNTELTRYKEASLNLAKEVIAVNSFSDEGALGGGFYIRDNQFIVNQPMEQKGISLVEI